MEYLNDIIEIVDKSLGERYDPPIYESISQYWRDGFIVVLENNRVIGFLLGVTVSRDETRILMLAVREESRNKGVGMAMMKQFIERSSNLGVKRISLEVRVSNKVAISFYLHFGFTFQSVIKEYYTDGEDGYQMVKYL